MAEIKNDQAVVENEQNTSTVESSNVFVKFGMKCKTIFDKFAEKHPSIAQFIVFFIVCNAVTVLQMIMLPVFKAIFNMTSLVDVTFQFGAIGTKIDGSKYFMFDYIAGPINADGIGGGLAYFLAIQFTLGVAQVVNFITQRNVTFKANNNVWFAAMWYIIAYIAITLVAAAAQGLYKAPLYKLLITTWGWGSTGAVIADVVTVIINSAISFWVFFPIMKLIFKQK